ncbi:alpha/beta hydrolase [Altererythrobacter sp. ZODW24]|uniref:alpha/beta fold hydrolase n=1 Tax=Altererythrobacter sp. ZODW24 TaxID=2185142 RepID=UPI000DF792DB|nr:alpha/beta hydrolase [Altererythrobacter sp. ZODW24]
MKRLAKILLVIFIGLMLAFVIFRTPDTDPVEMRAKYGGEPSQFVDVGDGLRVHLRDEGPRDAPVVMLLHGSNADLHTWEPWTEALKSEYRVIRFDQIGHGLTGPAPDNNYTMPSFTSTITKVADELDLGTFVIGGNSMGGGIAMAYALEHPERLDGLVLVDASGAPIEREGGGNLAFTLAQIPGVGSVLSQMLPRSLVERSLSQSVSNQEVVTSEAVDRYWEMARYPGNRDATRARFATPRTAFTPEQAQGMQVPTLVMWGEEDSLIPFAASAWFKSNLPNAVEVTYPGIGHLPMEEAAGPSSSDLRKWLANLPLSTEAGQ